MKVFDQDLGHHAYLIHGDIDKNYEILLEKLSGLGYQVEGNPDASVESYEVLGIDDVRAIKATQEETKVLDGKKFVILKINSFSYPAQNAMLKVFEEPKANLHFFIITTGINTLLDTLKSRLYLVEGEEGGDEIEKVAKKFINTSKKERIDFVKKFTDADSKVLLKDETMDFLNILESELHVKKADPEIFEEIWNVKKYLKDQGSSPKLLLEHLALVI